jgi:hypothetical protein
MARPGGRTRAPVSSLRRRWLLCLVGSPAVFLFGSSGVARAEVLDRPDSPLRWVAPPGCPDAQAARAAVERYLGDAGAFPSMAIQVELAPADGGAWQGRVTLRSDLGDGDRLFRGQSCADVAEAATLMVAIMVDPLRVASHVERLEDARQAAPAGRSAARPLAFEVGVETSADLASLPAPTLGLSLVAGVRMSRLLVRTAFTGWIPQRAFRGGDASSGGLIGLYSGSVRGCVDALSDSGGRFGVGPCVAAELGVATGHGFGLDVPETTVGPWAAAFAGGRAWFGSDPVASWLSVDVGSPLLRPVYVVNGAVPVFQPAKILLRISLGMAWNFP